MQCAAIARTVPTLFLPCPVSKAELAIPSTQLTTDVTAATRFTQGGLEINPLPDFQSAVEKAMEHVRELSEDGDPLLVKEILTQPITGKTTLSQLHEVDRPSAVDLLQAPGPLRRV